MYSAFLDWCVRVIEHWNNLTALGKIGLCAVIVFVGFLAVSVSMSEESNQQAREVIPQTNSATTVAHTRSATATAQADAAEQRRKGFHCLSLWDGNHDLFEGLVRNKLNDPSSMETFETRVSPVENGKHEIIMEFGARNAFGGMVRKLAIGTYDHKTCEPALLAIE